MYPTIKITTFGTLQVVRGDHHVTESDWHTRQARQLLKILITDRPRPVATDRLIETLWPNSAPQTAATTLRSAINALRNVLEPDRPNRGPSRYILTQAPGYSFRLRDEIWLDTEIFERQLEQAHRLSTQTNPSQHRQHLQTAIALYTDDYLISDPYADWAQNERQRLQELYFQALLDLAELHALSGDFPAAIAACRQIIARDNVRENAHQALMRYQALSGDSAGALITYERCRALLTEELGADPSPYTQTLHQRILNGELGASLTGSLPQNAYPLTQTTPPESTALQLPQRTLMPVLNTHFTEIFVGRENEINYLQSRLQIALNGQGDLVILEGEAGVGKTRLAYPILQHAADAGATILSVTCQALEQQLPFAPIADSLGRYLRSLPDAILRQLPTASMAHIAQIIPSLQDRLPSLPPPQSEPTLRAEENRQRLVDALVTFLSTIARARPMLLFLDDLHWADADTLAVLGRLAQHITDDPFFLLLAYRTDDLRQNEALATLRHALKRTARPHIITLPRLTQDDVQRMVYQLTKQQDAASTKLAALLYNATQGNALFIAEAVRDLMERQIPPPSTERSLMLPPDGSVNDLSTLLSLHQNQRVQEVIQERIDRLPTEAQSVLQTAAAIRRDFSLELLEAAADPATDPANGLQELLERKFLVERPDERLDFSHHVVRQVAYDQLNTLQRRRLHLRIANALKNLGRDKENPSETAFHLGLAGPSASQSFAHYSVLAGDSLRRTFGFRQAITHYDNALAVLKNQSNSPPALIRRSLRGRGLAFESLFDPEGVIDAYWQMQQWASEQGDRELLLAAYGRLSSLLALLGQQRESNQFMEELFTVLTNTASATSATYSHVITDILARRRLIYSAETIPEPESETWHIPYTIPPPAVTDPVKDLLQNIEPAYAVLPLFDYGWTLRVQGQFSDAITCFENVVKLAGQTAQPSIASRAYHQLAGIARACGDFAQSHKLNEKSIYSSQQAQSDDAELSSLWPRIASAFLALQLDQIDEAERRLQRVLSTLEGRSAFDTYRTSARIGLGWVAILRGHLDDAKIILEPTVASSASLYPYTHVRSLLGLARIAHHQHNPAASAAYLRRALRFAGQRSLLEEYIETVLEIATLRPTHAPIESLLRTTLAHIEPLHLAITPALRSALAEIPLISNPTLS